MAVFDHYVLAVWIGNFDGRPNNAFVGRTAAGPLLFQVIDSLRANWPQPAQPHAPPPGANLKRVELCAVSGQLPEACCSQRIEGWFIPGVSPIKTCEVHREILVDNATGLRIAHNDEKRGVRREVYEFWPSEMLALFERAGMPRRTAPPFLPSDDPETGARQGQAPQIISPNAAPGREVVLTAAGAKSIPLRARTDADVRELYWFAGKAFIGKSAPTDVLSWKSVPGRHELSALDDHGRAGFCTVEVR